MMIEQNDQMDFVVRLFQTSTSKIEDLAGKLEKLVKDNEENKSNFSDFLKDYDENEKFQITINNSHFSHFKDLENSLSKHFTKLETHSQDIKSLQMLCDVNCKTIGDHSSQIDLFLSDRPKYVNVTSLMQLENKIFNEIIKSQSFAEHAQDAYLKLLNKQNCMNDDHRVLNGAFETLKKSHESELLNQEQIRQATINLKLALVSEMESWNKKTLDQVDEKIASIPKPVIPSLDDAKKAFTTQLEPAQFDARNANLRAVNNESKITLLEKKVEQLQLLLNKLQLQG